MCLGSFVLKIADKMCEKHVGQCFVLRALHRLPSHSSVSHSVFQALIVFSMTVFTMEIISQSLLTWFSRNITEMQ